MINRECLNLYKSYLLYVSLFVLCKFSADLLLDKRRLCLWGSGGANWQLWSESEKLFLCSSPVVSSPFSQTYSQHWLNDGSPNTKTTKHTPVASLTYNVEWMPSRMRCLTSSLALKLVAWQTSKRASKGSNKFFQVLLLRNLSRMSSQDSNSSATFCCSWQAC